jgi:hypothetical protein
MNQQCKNLYWLSTTPTYNCRASFTWKIMCHNVSHTLTVILQLKSSGDKIYLVVLALPTLIPPFDFCIETTKSWDTLLDIRPPVLQRTLGPRICSLLVLIVEFSDYCKIALHCLVNFNNQILAHVKVCRAERLIHYCWKVLRSFMSSFFYEIRNVKVA